MKSYKIISDSSCDLPNYIAEEYDIHIVPFLVSFDGEKYFREGIDITNVEFYKKIKDENAFAKTSLPPVQDYIDVFTKYLDDGLDIICICISSTFSGSYQSATNAKLALEDKYPNNKIFVIDSKHACGSQGLLVIEACRMLEASVDIKRNTEVLEILKENAGIYFTLDSLEYLQKGGRIGKSAALAGALLNIKPIICLKDGELLPFAKVRGRKKALSEIIKIATTNVLDLKDNYTISIFNSDSLEDSVFVRDYLIDNYGFEIKYEPINIGVTVGSHIGRTAVGICFINKFESVI